MKIGEPDNRAISWTEEAEENTGQKDIDRALTQERSGRISENS